MVVLRNESNLIRSEFMSIVRFYELYYHYLHKIAQMFVNNEHIRSIERYPFFSTIAMLLENEKTCHFTKIRAKLNFFHKQIYQLKSFYNMYLGF